MKSAPLTATASRPRVRHRELVNRRTVALLIVESLTFTRVFAAIGLSILHQDNARFALSIVVVAFSTDILDGILARTYSVATPFGSAFDLIADKMFTVCSLLVAAKYGFNLFPLAVIASREFVVIGFRLINMNGKPVLPSSKAFGGTMAAVLWTNTFLIFLPTSSMRLRSAIGSAYWVVSILCVLNLAIRFYLGRAVLKAALNNHSE